MTYKALVLRNNPILRVGNEKKKQTVTTYRATLTENDRKTSKTALLQPRL